MIKYALRCGARHQFDAWFRDSAAYEEQAAAGVIRCPECGTPDVGKAIMAPAVGRARDARGPRGERAERDHPRLEAVPAAPPVPAAEAAGRQMSVAGKMREALHELRRYVEANADYVGERFADEARKIHKGEAEERAIYGESTEAEAEALHEEGVVFSRVPWPEKHDA